MCIERPHSTPADNVGSCAFVVQNFKEIAKSAGTSLNPKTEEEKKAMAQKNGPILGSSFVSEYDELWGSLESHQGKDWAEDEQEVRRKLKSQETAPIGKVTTCDPSVMFDAEGTFAELAIRKRASTLAPGGQHSTS